MPQMKSIAVIAFFVVVTNVANGIEVISAFNGGGLGEVAGDQTAGFTFTVGPSPMVVTQLGVWDWFGDGLLQPHEVGLWDMAGDLLASVTIPSGTSAALINGFRYKPITDVLLSPGATYVLGAFYLSRSRDLLTIQTVATTGPGVSFGEPRYYVNSASGFPNIPGPSVDNAFFGPNAILVSPVPDSLPGCSLFLMVILVGLRNGIAARRRKKLNAAEPKTKNIFTTEIQRTPRKMRESIRKTCSVCGVSRD
jgi:hypothetical protein